MNDAALLDAAGRRRSPATMPGYPDATSQQGAALPPDPPCVEEVVASCVRRARRPMDCALERWSFCYGVRGCASARLSRSAKATSTEPAGVSSSAAARAASDVRSAWIAGRGSRSTRGFASRLAVRRRTALRHRRPYARSPVVTGGRPGNASPPRRGRPRPTLLRAPSASPRTRR